MCQVLLYRGKDGIATIDYSTHGSLFASYNNSWVVTVTETSAPAGYLLPDSTDRTDTKVVTSGQEKVSFLFTNDPIPGILITKKSAENDENGNTLFLEGAVYNVTIDDHEIYGVTTGEDGTVLIDYDTYSNFIGDSDGSWTVIVEEVSPPAGYLLPEEPIQVAELIKGQTLLSFVFVNHRIPDITITKISSTNNEDGETHYLAGAVYDIDIDGFDIKGKVTDENGMIVITYDEYGAYLDLTRDSWSVKVTEVSPPAGFLLPDDADMQIQTAEFRKGQTQLDFVFVNDPIPGISIYKKSTEKDDEGNPIYLSGAVYDIEIDGYDIKGAETDENGIIIIDYDSFESFLNPTAESWSVKVTEVSAPYGYLLPDDPDMRIQTGELRRGQSHIDFYFENEPIPEIRIYKKSARVDADGNEVYLAGAVYDVQINGHDIKGCITNEDGMIVIDWEEWGTVVDKTASSWTITVEEVYPPDGYLLPEDADKQIQTGELFRGQTHIDFVFINEPLPGITIYKKSSELDENGNSIYLAGAVYDVQIDGYDIKGVVTDENGMFNIDWDEFPSFLDLTADSWTVTVTEVAAPDGYLLPNNADEQIQTGELTRGQSHIDFVFTNIPIPEIHIYKKSSENDENKNSIYLAGAVYDVVIDGHEIKGVVTDENGMIVINWEEYSSFLNLTADSWSVIVTEVTAPDGYLLPNNAEEQIQVGELIRGQSHINFVFTNEPIPEIHIYKKAAHLDEDGNSIYLAGAVYDVEIDGLDIKGVTTDENGIFIIDWEEWGSYLNQTADSWSVKVTEVKAPDGYLLSDDIDQRIQTGELRRGQTHLDFVFENERIPEIRIYKKSGMNDENNQTVWLEGAVYDVQIDGYDIKGVTTDENGEIIISWEEWGDFIDITASSWTVIVEEVTPPPGYLYPEEPIQTGELRRDQGHLDFIFVNYPVQVIEIWKSSADTGLPLSDAYFKVWIDEIAIGEYKTDENGLITVTYEEFGHYLDISDEEWIVKVEEISAPPGYLLPVDAVHSLRMDIGMTKLVFEIENSAYPMIEINKYEANTSLGLAGASFEVKIDAQSMGTWETDENGKIYITYDEYKNWLPSGKESWTVTVEEMTAPSGYINDNADKPVTYELRLGQALQSFIFYNTKYPEVTIKKVDREDPTKGLEGATFKVMFDAVEIPGPWVTDQNGEVVISWDVIGRYLNEDNTAHWTVTATELLAPTNYNLDAQPTTGDYTQTAQFQAGISDVTLLFSDTSYRSIQVTKKDSGSSSLLSGAEFTLTAISLDDGNASAWGSRVLTTDATGTVLFENVPNGTYQITETNAPNGYEINTMVITVVVTSESPKVIEVDFTNDPYTSLFIMKLDRDDNSPVAGAKFKVEKAANSLVGTYETDQNGEILVSGISSGTYVVTEISAPEGYILDSEPQTIVVENGKRAYLEFYNSKQGSLILYLNDIESNEPLQGGEFELRRSSDDVIITIKTTDEAGSIVFGSLDAGSYVITQNYAPENYWIIDGQERQEIIIESGKQDTLNFYNETSALTIKKMDSITLDSLEGARFKVTRNSDNLVIGEYETGRDGLALVSGLQPGMYTVQEIVAPSGYTLDSAAQIVEVKRSLNAQVEFYNDPNSNITIHVVDEATRVPLANAMIEIWKQNGKFVESATTDVNGMYSSSALAPGYYVVKLNTSNIFGNYTCDIPEVTIQVVDGTSTTHYFECYASGNLEVRSTDSSGAIMSGMTFTLTKVNGEIIGTYTTTVSGNYIITGLDAAVYVVTPTQAPEGYTLNSTPVNVTIENAKTTTVSIAHDKIYGLQIFTSDVNDGTPVSGVTYQIATLEGMLVATATSDYDGLSFTTLTPGYYVVTPTSAPDNYVFTDASAVTIEVLANGLTTMSFTVQKMSTIKVQFVDGDTNAPIYGVRVLISSNGGTLETLTSDANGYIQLNQAFISDDHTIEVISVPEGYRVDNVPRPIATLAGGTTEIIWVMYKDAGQLQVILTSSDYNTTLDKAAGSPVQGAIFEIQNPYTYQVVGYMITDAQGIAASSGLPIGRYLIKQVTEAPYYATSSVVSEVYIKTNNDIVRTAYQCQSVSMIVEVEIESNKQVTAGTAFRVDIKKANNTSDVRLDNFFLHIKVPTDGARATTLLTGVWSHPVDYSISYKTNLTDYRLLSNFLQADSQYQYELDANSLGLQMDEYLTDIRYEFGEVPRQFTMTEQGALMLYSLSTLSYEYNLITRIEAGGMFSTSILSTNGSTSTNSNASSGSASATTAYIVGTTGIWDTGTAVWTSSVIGGDGTLLNPELPKTGY